MEAEKQELARQDTHRHGKHLTSVSTTEGTSRQQVLAAKKREGKQVARDEGVDTIGRKSAPPKRSKEPKGKGVALPQEEENADITEDDQAPHKKAKVSKGKKVDTERDRTKTPTEDELYGHLRNGVLWPPTRFADIKIMEGLEIGDDIKQMLEHMNMQSFFTMAYPTYEDESCQFLSSLVATFHTTKHVRQGWGKIKFKIHGKVYNMTFKEIGQALGLQDLEESSIPILYDAPREEIIARMVWKVLAGKTRKPSHDKNAFIRHPSVRHLHWLIVHTIFPRKEPGTVNDEELQLLHQTVQHYAHPSQLPFVDTDFYKNFGMVGFFVKHLVHYKEWAWTTSDSELQVGIGGLITPLLRFKDIPSEDDPTGPALLDGSYLKKAQYFNGRFNGTCVYSYIQSTREVEVLLPNTALTSLTRPGAISLDIGSEHFLGSHGPLGPIRSPKRKKTAYKCGVFQEEASGLNSELLYGPPRYYFEQHPGALPHGPLRQVHEHISKLQRWNKAQDRTIFKLKDKCKALSKTVKRQAEDSAQFMKKVADILTRGAVVRCSSSDFDFLNPQPQPSIGPLALRLPTTEKELLRQKRNPPAQQSDSGNKSPSLASTDEEADTEDEASASSHAS
ncbi:hypothetical protein F2Q68_00030900 [Brassica cretica]|uniref:Arabidopsis retrotransposon Orf1 C-terminal domain-containing protein n=1 Tax=Brassica cretica TaxID=69181 RepID=A0A8S9GGM7_BRACR|nr:hypothetical protein F2Q68_00030900 [Brassica cretica]